MSADRRSQTAATDRRLRMGFRCMYCKRPAKIDRNKKDSIRKAQAMFARSCGSAACCAERLRLSVALCAKFLGRRLRLRLNPVRRGLVTRAEDYRWSSVRCWWGKSLPDEPLLMDLGQLAWRKRRSE